MWVVIEMEGTGLTDEVSKVIGPFDTHKAAFDYMLRHGYDGAFEVRPPEEEEN